MNDLARASPILILAGAAAGSPASGGRGPQRFPSRAAGPTGPTSENLSLKTKNRDIFVEVVLNRRNIFLAIVFDAFNEAIDCVNEMNIMANPSVTLCSPFHL